MATYYVSASGNDSNNGTSTGTPWLTIAKVNSTIASGDIVNFNGGDTFSGNLVVNVPATIQSYGTGKANINPGNGHGIETVDASNVTIRDIKVTGPGINLTGTFPSQTASTTSTGAGIYFRTTTASTTYTGALVEDCEITGTFEGIYFLNTNTSATVAHSGLIIQDNYVHHVGGHGIWVMGSGTLPSGDTAARIYASPIIRRNTIIHVPGVGAWGGVTIRSYNSTNALIEGNYCSYNGWVATGFPVSILLVYSDDTVFRGNEVSFFYTGGGDGQGIDPDLGCQRAIVEYNYVHDSPYAGLFNYQSSDSIYRYNIVERCNGSFKGNAGSATLYHNTLYNTGSNPTVESNGTIALYNNIIAANSGNELIHHSQNPAAMTMKGNAYETIGGSSFLVILDTSTNYTSLAALRSAGFEKHAGVDYGAHGAMAFSNAGNGTDQLPNNPVSSLTAYDIGSSSAARDAGLTLSLVSITAPSTDWHGVTVGLTTPDSGAVVYVLVVNAGRLGPTRRLLLQ